jgi:FAD/FMN-containing dehydrogenase
LHGSQNTQGCLRAICKPLNALDANALALMRAIKREFDPDGVLNPGKLLP